jgi:hypothetical protein
MSARTSPDLHAATPPPVDWAPGRSTESVAALHDWAQRLAADTIGWYLTEKRSKARWSRGLRAATAILTAFGGAAPVTALSAGRPALGNWGFVLLAAAGACMVYDRFFGYSSAWLRYMSTATALRGLINDFQLRWTAELARLGGREPDSEDVVVLIELVRLFAGSVQDAVRTETESWLTEFHTRLNEMETRISDNRPQPTVPPARR